MCPVSSGTQTAGPSTANNLEGTARLVSFWSALRHLVQEDAQRNPSFVVGTVSRFSSVAAALKHIHPGTAAGQQPR